MPKKNPRKPAGAPVSPERQREQHTSQPPTLSTPPVPSASLWYPPRARPTDSWCLPIAHSSTWSTAPADDDDGFMRSGFVNPNVILPQVLPFDDSSLEEGRGPSTSDTISSLTFCQQDSGVDDDHHAAHGTSSPRYPYAERSPGAATYESESVYDLEYSTAHVSYPSFSGGTDPGTSGYPNYAATGYQSEDAESSLSSYVRHSLAVSDSVQEPSGTAGNLVNPSPGSYDDPAGRMAPGVGTHQLSVQSTSEESDAPSSSGSVSRKGSYKHRHRRVYGLSQEDQVERSKTLNNEASLLYRERKRKKERDLEAEARQEEERQQRLRRHEQKLKRKLEILNEALGKRDDRGRPGNGSLNL
ncbi:uncharacterized protein [Macrobrachium rosenbergii]|uniref:uncharacterized protein n=1 Tax=Macrobrachium rosenbergii TaxID=79674 RepID=UPI0034D6A9A3